MNGRQPTVKLIKMTSETSSRSPRYPASLSRLLSRRRRGWPLPSTLPSDCALFIPYPLKRLDRRGRAGLGGHALDQAFERAGRDDARRPESRRREELAELLFGAFAAAGHDEHLEV